MTPRERAKQIVDEWFVGNAWPCDGQALPKLEDAITAALTVPDGHVRGPDGVDRKVLGKPVITADSAYAFPNARVVCPNGHEGAKVLGGRTWCGEGNCWNSGCQGDGPSGSTYPVGECFSDLATREAALAARKEAGQ